MGHSETGEQTLTASDDAVAPVFVDVRAPEQHSQSQSSERTVTGTASSLAELISDEAGPLAPDWDAWAQILALGAPLAGRTPFAGFRRLQPGQSAVRHQRAWTVRDEPWSWAEVLPDPQLNIDDLTGPVIEAMRSQISAAGQGPAGQACKPLQPMLSGGRDSRMLTALAAQQSAPEQITAWTTSSDTGTSMEELVAARTAGILGVNHRIVPAHHHRFAQDVQDYARTVDYMASFHIWLMPVARELAHQQGTILDGLGGGVFLGGGFPDHPSLAETTPSEDQILDSRFRRLAHYLEAADEVLAPAAAQELEDRARADFDAVARPYAKHPNGTTLTAYLTRTLPGISLAPAKVLSGALPTLTPITTTEVVTQALRLAPEHKHDGAWYPHLLKSADARLTDLPTAADLTGRRQHTRRGASAAAAQWYRDLLLGGPVEPLLAESLRTAEIPHWSALLSKTKPQHLIRGLAMLALWLREYRPQLAEAHPPFAGGHDG